MQNEVLKLKLSGFYIEKVQIQDCQAEIEAHSLAHRAACPVCGQTSKRVHSWYQRHPQDLPWCGIRVRLHLHVRKFFCDNPDCPRRIFVERLPDLLSVHAQKTTRLRETSRLLALGLGGELGARLLAHLGITTSPDTLLRSMRQQPLSLSASPRVVGVDDWAYRRGRIYGTIVCDLERHAVLDLLPDREAETLAQWLQAYPSIAIVSRDRSAAYIEGIARGAPQAVQVADRWHLLKNWRESVQKQLEQLQRRFEWPLELSEDQTTPAQPVDILESPALREARLGRRRQRLERYQQVLDLLRQGSTQRQVAVRVGLSLATIKRYWKALEYPERKRRSLQSSLIDPFQDYILKRWYEGCTNAMQLWRELREQGFAGSYNTVARALRRLRSGFSVRRASEVKATKARHKRLSAQEIAWLFVLAPERLAAEQVQDLTSVWRHYPQTQAVYQLARDFVQLVQNKAVEQLTGWMQQVEQSAFRELQSFVKGLRKDQAAVVAALTLAWSNGPVEGQVNRLKLIKRQMYGSAKFDLLRQRVLMRL